jgi:hypothetical protein
VLAGRRFRWPFVLTRTFALDSCPSHMLSVIVQTSSGAVHGEDRLSQRFDVREGAAAYVTTQGASPIHRAGAGSESRDGVTLAVARGGYLEYLPEARILFPDSALDQTIEIECALGGMALVSDAFTIHNLGGARGFRRFRSTTVLRCDGDLSSSIGPISSRSGQAGRPASAPSARSSSPRLARRRRPLRWRRIFRGRSRRLPASTPRPVPFQGTPAWASASQRASCGICGAARLRSGLVSAARSTARPRHRAEKEMIEYRSACHRHLSRLSRSNPMLELLAKSPCLSSSLL